MATVDFADLQRVIDSNRWRDDVDLFHWIWEQFELICAGGRIPPEDFGTPDFWNVIAENPTVQRGGRRRRPSLPFIADTPGAARANLVPYSDSEDDEEEEEVEERREEEEDAEDGTDLPNFADPGDGPAPADHGQFPHVQRAVHRAVYYRGRQPRDRPNNRPLADFYQLSESRNVRVRRLNVQGQQYTLRLRNQHEMYDIETILRGIFDEILAVAYADAGYSDRVGLRIRHTGLEKSYLLGFRRRQELNGETILRIIEMLLISHEDWDLDDDFEIDFTHVTMPRGARPLDTDGSRFRHDLFMKKHSKGHGACFITINNRNDELCLPRALVVAKARIDKQTNPEVARQWETIRKGDRRRCTLQKNMALKLMKDTGLEDHVGPCGEEQIQKLQAFLEPDYQIKIFSAIACNFLTFQGPTQSDKVLHIYHDCTEDGQDGHFVVLTKPHILFHRQHWCDRCNMGFNTKSAHKCTLKCYCCFRLQECPVDEWRFCNDCNRRFPNEDCFRAHQNSTERQQGNKRVKTLSTCEKIKRCGDCKRLLPARQMERLDGGIVKHACDQAWCRNCKILAEIEGHHCFIMPPEEKKPRNYSKKKKKAATEMKKDAVPCGPLDEGFLSLLKDMAAKAGAEESESLDESVSETEESKSTLDEEEERALWQPFTSEEDEEVLNRKELGMKIFFDFECVQEKVVGTNKLGPIYEHEPNLCVALKVCNKCKRDVLARKYGGCSFCGKNEYIFKGASSRDDFCRWLFSEENVGATAIAHNSKAYDSQFLCRYLITQAFCPLVICRGRDLLMLSFNGIKVIDSRNFLPMALSELPKAFDEKELKKGYFPFKFSKKENESYVGPWPDSWFYDPGHMKPEKRDDFYKWYIDQIEKEFDFEKEILAYCRSDCDILMRCCLKFEEAFLELTGVKPFDVAITIASACMYVFRKNFMKHYTIGCVPPGGYRRHEKQSVIGLKWLKWISHKRDIRIQHARNGLEKKVGAYKVDGFDGTKVYEFHGCHWHSCLKCYPKDRLRTFPGSKLTMEDKYQRTLEKSSFIRAQGYPLEEIWECELRKQLKEDAEMREFFDSITEIPEPLNPREALRGGRTNATCLYHKTKEGEYIRYVDVCSLYPWAVKWTVFPVGHPVIITENFQPISAGNNPYFGLIKCTVQAPKKLLHPLLPYSCRGKLMFPLCRTCTQEEHQGYCTHTDAERSLSGTWVSTELNKALELGYVVEKIDEVWHYEQTDQFDGIDTSSGLFTKFINCFLKIKIENSGWPAWVQSEEDQDKFIQNCMDREGIALEKDNIRKNSAYRGLAKLMLNSFWGKFGQRENLGQNVYVNSPVELSKIVFDDTNQVQDIRIMSEKLLLVNYKKEEDFVEVMTSTNPVLASFTTANARLKLYEELEKLQERVLYFDTDSIIYLTKPGDLYHPALGSFLGDMTNELEEYGDGAYIDEFVSGGPKNYAYRVRLPDGSVVSKVKIRGFTLNYHTAATLNRRKLREKVMKFVADGTKEQTVIVETRIVKTDNREVVTKQVAKNYGIVYSKRWVMPNFYTMPFGMRQ